MDIVDCQSHLGPGGIPELLAAMDALGIKGVVIDEVWFGFPEQMPTYRVAGRTGMLRRFVSPTAELAAMTYPDRISFMGKIDRNDPEIPGLIRLARDATSCRALRTSLGLSKSELGAMASGGYDEMFGLAGEAGLPVFVTIPGNAPALRSVAEKFPGTTFIVDHCGMPFTNQMQAALKATGYGDDLAQMGTGGTHAQEFDKVLALADLPNVALKWGHAQGLFAVSGYPFVGLRPYLRSAMDAFGSQRMMWAGDASVNLTGESWAQLLFWLIENPDISQEERANFLGGTVRRLLNWPA